jgi:hypothetical protein
VPAIVPPSDRTTAWPQTRDDVLAVRAAEAR